MLQARTDVGKAQGAAGCGGTSRIGRRLTKATRASLSPVVDSSRGTMHITGGSRFAFSAGSLLLFLLMAGTAGQALHPQERGPEDRDAMMHRGETGMGFSQIATTHHFRLKPDGGVIAVTANDPKDTAARDQIRMHLTHIARAFSAGDFDIPMFVHDQDPPGVPAMKHVAKRIRYEFRETERGGEVSIESKSPAAVRAIHDFLIFQIREHKTGDPLSGAKE